MIPGNLVQCALSYTTCGEDGPEQDGWSEGCLVGVYGMYTLSFASNLNFTLERGTLSNSVRKGSQ